MPGTGDGRSRMHARGTLLRCSSSPALDAVAGSWRPAVAPSAATAARGDGSRRSTGVTACWALMACWGAGATPETLEALLTKHRGDIDEELLEMLYERIEVAKEFEEVRPARAAPHATPCAPRSNRVAASELRLVSHDRRRGGVCTHARAACCWDRCGATARSTAIVPSGACPGRAATAHA